MPNPEIEETVSQFFVYYYASRATEALIIYDTLITIRLEKENIWERKINATSLLYIWTRWTLLLNAVLGLVTAYYSGPTVEPTCHIQNAIIIYGGIFDISSYIQCAIFAALRASALWDRNCVIFVGVLAFGLVPVVTNTFGQTRIEYPTHPSPEGICIATVHVSHRLDQIMLLVTRISPIVGDTLVLVLTLIKTVALKQEAMQVDMPVPIVDSLLSHGVSYLIVIIVVNLARILVPFPTVIPPVSPLLKVVPPIMICRFIIGLRAVTDRGNEAVSNPSYLRFQVPAFLTANMGELLQPRFMTADEDGLDEEGFALEYTMTHPAVDEGSQRDVVEI